MTIGHPYAYTDHSKPKRKIWPWILGGAVLVMIALCGAGIVIAAASGPPTSNHALITPTTTTKTGAATPTKTAGKPAAPVSSEQSNANRKAEQYLQYQAFSRKSLIEQLKFEGYSTKVSTTAVDAQKADWNQQAVKKAKEYLQGQPFSKQGLRDQLEFEGFSSSQAAYGVSKSGL